MASARAVIYVLAGPASARAEQKCFEYCLNKGYKVLALVRDTQSGRLWRDAVRALRDEDGDVIVVADQSQLPHLRSPRMEVVADEVQRSRRVRFQRRPQIIGR